MLPLGGGIALAGAFGYPLYWEASFIGTILTATSVSISAQTLIELRALRSPPLTREPAMTDTIESEKTPNELTHRGEPTGRAGGGLDKRVLQRPRSSRRRGLLRARRRGEVGWRVRVRMRREPRGPGASQEACC